MRIFLGTFLFCLAFLIPSTASAAILSVVPDSTKINVGQEVSAKITINTEETAINAAQGTITFPSGTLEVKSIDFINSVFNFWVEEPTFDNETGEITFIGGTAKGVTGEELVVATIKFKSIGSGQAVVSVEDSAITASDGKGTNVLSSITGTTITVGVDTYIPEPEFNPKEVVVEAVKQVTRKATEATGLPIAPNVSVPLYPESSKWYKHQEQVTAFWEIPDDVTKVAISVDDNPNSEPEKAENALYNGKELGVFDVGETYIHVQFRNSVGWGPVTHYRVAIDLEAPLPFTIEFDGAVGDDPTPTFFIDSFDALSGIGKVVVSIDGTDSYEFASTTITLPPQKPGMHTMIVSVFDKARNSIERSTSFEIDALPTPSISFITSSISQNEQGFISGNSISGGFVDVVVKDDSDIPVSNGVAATDESGNWRFVFDEVLPIGKYNVVVSARDQRGAISYPSDPVRIQVRPQTVLSFGFIELGWFEIFLILLLIGTTVAGGVAYYYVKQQDTQSAYATIAARDVKKFGDIILRHLDIVENSINSKKNKIDKQLRGEVDNAIADLKSTVVKMNKYLVDLINKA